MKESIIEKVMRKIPFNQIKKVLYYLIPIGIFIWSSQMIFNNSIWLDEAFSLSMMEQSFIDIIKNTAIDVHPPLYYIVLKIFYNIFSIFIENKTVIAKLVSLFPIGVLIIVSYKDIAKLFGKKTAFLFNILILGMPQIMSYAIEIRMYSLGLLLVTLFFISCVKYERENTNKNYVFIIIYSTLAAYTHYFAGISVVCIFALFIINAIIQKDIKKLKKYLISILIAFLLYLPWIIIFFKQLLTVKESYWIEEITINKIKSFLKYPYAISGNKKITYLIELIFIISACLLLKRDKNNKYVFIGMITPYLTILIGVIASYIIRPVFISRYIVCALGVFWLGVAISLSKLSNKKIIFGIICAGVLIITLYNNYNLIQKEENYKENTIETMEYMDEINDESVAIIFNSSYLQRVISYLYPNIDTYVYNQPITELTQKVYNQSKMYVLDEINIDEINSDKIYIFSTKEEFITEIEDVGLELEKEGKYSIETYTFSVYKIIK